MKNKLRHVHVNNIEWSYAVSKGEVRIYTPFTKQIISRIAAYDVTEIGSGVSPKLVQTYIKDELHEPYLIREKIKFLSSSIKGIYKTIYASTEDINLFAFEIAQQANTDPDAKKGAENAVGKEIVELSLKLYPNVKLGDKYIKK